MTCSSSENLFEAYLDDTLLPAQRARLLGHLNGCGRCKGVFDELRVVDALLASPRAVELPENFTFAILAEVRAIPSPLGARAPVLAYLISYLVAAWLLVGAGFLLAGNMMRAFGEIAIDASAQLLHTFGAVGQAGARVVGDFGSLSAFLGAAIVLDLAAVLVLVVGFTMVRPRLAERLRP